MTAEIIGSRWRPETSNDQELGLYLHIPFCSQLCHYCDFAKTANFDHPLAARYFSALLEHLKIWTGAWESSSAARPKFTSFFWGGGTPGLFAVEMAPIFSFIKKYLADDCEVSLEVNPGNVTQESLEIWRRLGFNRISIGVQTFDRSGLDFLKRDHSGDEAMAAVTLAQKFFDNVSLDLIYGWQDQTFEGWKNDLSVAISLKTTHISLYNLIYEASTPIGRAMQRGILKPVDEELDLNCYQYGCNVLGAAGFIHDEVSNWAQSGYSSRHNWLYWQARPYLGVGSGAHGFLTTNSGIGNRYSYHSSERRFMEKCIIVDLNPAGEIELLAGVVKDHRDAESWLLEYIGCAMRCRMGADTRRVALTIGKHFYPSKKFIEAEEKGLISVDSSGVIRLDPSEWFREIAWSLVLLECFGSAK